MPSSRRTAARRSASEWSRGSLSSVSRSMGPSMYFEPPGIASAARPRAAPRGRPAGEGRGSGEERAVAAHRIHADVAAAVDAAGVAAELARRALGAAGAGGREEARSRRQGRSGGGGGADREGGPEFGGPCRG